MNTRVAVYARYSTDLQRAASIEDQVRRCKERIKREGWRLVDNGLAALVASDGHRATRPMLLDGAYELTRARVGEEQALRLFDGSALGLAAPTATGQPAESATR